MTIALAGQAAVAGSSADGPSRAVGTGGAVGSGSAGDVVAPADGGGVSGEAGPVVVTVAVRASNGRGDHAWGTVEVEVDVEVERP